MSIATPLLPHSLSSELTAMLHGERFDEPPGDLTEPAELARWQDFRERYHRARLLDGPELFPLQLDVELNSQCNLRCAFCVHGQGKVEYAALDRPRFERLMEESQFDGLVSLKLNYINEPLMVHDLPDYVRSAKAHGVLNIYFATNGVLLGERMREELLAARVSKIMVSIDAATPETYLRMRRSKHYGRVVANIHALLELRAKRGSAWPLVRVNFLRTHENVEEAEAFVRLWDGVADIIGFQDQVGLPGVEGDLLRDPAYAAAEEDFRCSLPYKQLVVDSRGHILPCCTFSGRELPLGHVDEMTLAEAWRSRKMLELKLSHLEGRWRDNPVCYQCIHGDRPTAAPETNATLIQLGGLA